MAMRARLALALFLPALFVALPAAGGNGALGLATAFTAGLAVLFVAVALQVRLPATAATQVRAISLRERARLATFLRLRDPDAAGRVRSRAPSAAHAAA
jgi:Family of unknown function (DUF6412)